MSKKDRRMIMKNRIKYMHIFPNEKFASEYIHFINTYFDKKDHFFYLYGEKRFYQKDENTHNVVLVEECSRIKVMNDIRKAEHIMIHSLFLPRFLYPEFMSKRILKRTTVIFWGIDLYDRAEYMESHKNVASKVWYHVNKRMVNNAQAIGTLVPKDFKFVETIYQPKGFNVRVVYLNAIPNDKVLQTKIKVKQSNRVNVLVGNSANAMNRQVEIFTALQHLQAEIKVFCPLSYGDDKTKDEVIRKGNEMFGDNFVGVVDYMSPEDYLSFLSDMDVAIFHSKRQMALGNINALLFLGKKVYLNALGAMYDYYEDILDVKVYDSCCLADEDIVGFKANDAVDRNRGNIEKTFSNIYIKDVWSKLFDKLG